MALSRRMTRLFRGARPRSDTAGQKLAPARRGRGPQHVALPATGGFDVAVVAILKNESTYIEEWLCHHIAVGVDHFFLYDNGSSDDIHTVVRPYVDHGIVTFVYFPKRGLQRDANNHALRFFGAVSDWLAYVDIDEFLVPQADESLATVLKRFGDAEQVLVSRKELCYSGHRTRPEGLVTEAFTMVSENVPRMNRSDVLAKPIVRTSGTWRVGVHSADTVHGRTVNTAGEPSSEERTAIENPTYANLQMNHYYTKSWEDFQAKLQRATTSTHAFQLPQVPFDIPAEADHVIDRWIPRTKALMDEMRTLAASPSRYGSRLRLPDFPISDQFGAEAMAMISNEITGLDEPRKKRAFKSLPLPGVRGALARCDDHGYVPAANRFLGSAHARQELAWLEAEVTWQLVDGELPAAHEGDSLEASGDGWKLDLPNARGTLVIPAGGPPLRCHALLFALSVTGEVSIEIAAREVASGWGPAANVAIPGAGGYLGFIALDKLPRTIDAVRLSARGAEALTIYDLALVTFG